MKFAGRYPHSIKTILVASAVSGHNVVLLSPPGWGKSDMTRAVAHKISGEAGTVWLPLDPATPPEAVKGAYDPAALLNGKLNRVLTGTPYDPGAQIVILDEFARANDVVFDALVHVTSRKDLPDQDLRPVFWATTNFSPKTERTEALRDRFGLWIHLEPDLDVRAIISGHLNNGTGTDPDFTKGLPTWAECMQVRKARPTARTLGLIQEYIENLASEAKSENMEVNPRRIVHWSEILFRVGVWYSGSCDWTAIPKEAMVPMQWAYPTVDKAVAKKWTQIAGSITDQLGAAIEAIRSNALAEFQKVAAITDPQERVAKVTTLGKFLTQSQQDLCRLAGVEVAALKTINDPKNPINQRDPRIGECLRDIVTWFGAAINGQDLEELK